MAGDGEVSLTDIGGDGDVVLLDDGLVDIGGICYLACFRINAINGTDAWTLAHLFYNHTASNFRITAQNDVAFNPQPAVHPWNKHEHDGLNGGGVFITLDTSGQPNPPTPITPCLPGFTVAGFATSAEAAAYANGHSIDLWLPAGDLYAYYNYSASSCHSGGGTYCFKRL